MALTIQGKAQLGVLPGGNGKKFEMGTFAFTTTAANGLLSLRLRKLELLLITPAGTPAADENVSGPTIGDGGLIIDGTGQVTITRTGASKTSGLVCSFLAIGT